MTTEIPPRMQAVAITEPGGPEVLQLIETDTPVPGSDDVLIRVHACGVNRPDCLQRQGLYPAPAGASELPGLEVAGEVVRAPASSRFKPGDAVCALVNGGGYAEWCAVPEQQVLPVPAGLSMAEAASLPETWFTVWSNLVERGQLKPGEKVLIHGGASGIGSTAIQVAKAMGAWVAATAGSDEKVDFCRELGADIAVNYRNESFLEVLSAATGKVDVVLDIVGGSHLADNVRALGKDGRLVLVGVLGGAKAELNLSAVLMKRLTITGSTLRARPSAEKGLIAEALLAQAWPWFASGEAKPVIQQQLPLAEVAAAHSLLEANEARGKVVLITEFGEC